MFYNLTIKETTLSNIAIKIIMKFITIFVTPSPWNGFVTKIIHPKTVSLLSTFTNFFIATGIVIYNSIKTKMMEQTTHRRNVGKTDLKCMHISDLMCDYFPDKNWKRRYNCFAYYIMIVSKISGLHSIIQFSCVIV